MIWVLAAIVITTIGVMAVVDAYFEVDSAALRHISDLYFNSKEPLDDDVWWLSYELYYKSRQPYVYKIFSAIGEEE